MFISSERSNNLDRAGHWVVIQQRMHDTNGFARRYHWFGDHVQSFVDDPHAAIATEVTGDVWNLVAHESAAARDVTAQLAREQPEKVVVELSKLRELTLPAHHDIKRADVDPKRLHRILLKTYERQPEDFTTLLAMEGVGARTLRALSLVGELVYGVPVSITDPARFAFAHGGFFKGIRGVWRTIWCTSAIERDPNQPARCGQRS